MRNHKADMISWSIENPDKHICFGCKFSQSCEVSYVKAAEEGVLEPSLMILKSCPYFKANKALVGKLKETEKNDE